MTLSLNRVFYQTEAPSGLKASFDAFLSNLGLSILQRKLVLTGKHNLGTYASEFFKNGIAWLLDIDLESSDEAIGRLVGVNFEINKICQQSKNKNAISRIRHDRENGEVISAHQLTFF